MRIVSLITIAAFLSLALHVSTEHTGAVHGAFSIGHHAEDVHAGYEHSDNIPLCEHSDAPPHNVNSMRTKNGASVRDATFILIPLVSSIPDPDRVRFQDSSYSPAPHSNDVALHLSVCVFLL